MQQLRPFFSCYKKYMDSKQRKNEIMAAIGEVGETELKVLEPLIGDMVFLEGQLDELKQYPFINVNKKNPVQQKTTPAGKQYKELLQQYINCLKVIISFIGEQNVSEDSPLRKWLKNKVG